MSSSRAPTPASQGGRRRGGWRRARMSRAHRVVRSPMIEVEDRRETVVEGLAGGMGRWTCKAIQALKKGTPGNLVLGSVKHGPCLANRGLRVEAFDRKWVVVDLDGPISLIDQGQPSDVSAPGLHLLRAGAVSSSARGAVVGRAQEDQVVDLNVVSQ